MHMEQKNTQYAKKKKKEIKSNNLIKQYQDD